MATARQSATPTYDVGGVRLERPFQVLRLGHFGFSVEDQERALKFYSDLLGLPMSDTVDFARVFDIPNLDGKDSNGYFLRFGADHHSVVLFPRWTQATRPELQHDGTHYISHIAWQVGTLREVTEGREWLKQRQVTVARPGGRDARGANWNFTVADPDFISNELYYGMDQIGWDGVSKPVPICPKYPPLPELDEAADPDFPMALDAIEGGLDLRGGLHQRPFGEPKYDVGGIKLARPFRIVRNGPIHLYAHDLDAAERFYSEILGLTVTEEIEYNGHRCVFLRTNTEHHTIALYPLALREELGTRPDSLCMAYGMQLGSYRQLRDAIAFLEEHGVAVRYLPPELSPGMDYTALAIDPEGHAIQLYYYMEQIGWDGRPRPADQRRKVETDPAKWPEAVDALSDTYRGPVFQGPLG